MNIIVLLLVPDLVVQWEHYDRLRKGSGREFFNDQDKTILSQEILKMLQC
jgi:hypothetical protein